MCLPGHLRVELLRGIGMLGKVKINLLFDSQLDNAENEYRSSFQNYGAIVDYKLGKGNLHGYYGFDKTNRQFVDASYGPPVSYHYYGRFHHGELFLNYDIAKNIQLLSGVSWQRLKMLDELASEKKPSAGAGGAIT